MAKVTEPVVFRLIHTPCCGTLLCYVNPRMPNYCSECGARFAGGIKRSNPEAIMVHDDNALLTYDPEAK